MNTPFYPRLLAAVMVIACCVFAVLPLVALAFYNHPSPTDDYCFTDTALKFGFWQAQSLYYNGWSGRYFHNFIVHTNPMVWGWQGGYTVFPIVMVALVFGSFWTLARQLTRGIMSGWGPVALAAGGSFLFIGQLATIAEFFYWYTGLASYGLSSLFLLLLLAVWLAHARQQFRLASPWLVAQLLLLACIIGSSEASMVLVMSVLAMLSLCQLVYRRKLPAALLVAWGWALICCYFLTQAPGNAIRMGGNPQNQDFVFSTVGTLKHLLQYLPNQLLRTPLLPLSLLYLPVAYALTEPRGPVRSVFAISPLLALAHAAATVFALTFLHFWAVGVAPVDRVMNVVGLAFLLGWFFNLTVLVRVVRHRIGAFPVLMDYRFMVVLVAGLGLMLTTSQNKNLRMTYGDWKSGRAAQYDRAMRERYALMVSSPADTVTLAPLPVAPVSLTLEDIKADNRHLWNKCWASYYHKKGVQLRETSLNNLFGTAQLRPRTQP